LLAKEIGRRVEIEVDGSMLKRTKNTPPQVEMDSPEDRRANMSGSFRCESGLDVLKVLLVDDVVTTGSTMFACGDALKDAGAASVWGLALAR
jgi:predicted amidophosphoribosyltransferase